jgi:hypothetical protein
MFTFPLLCPAVSNDTKMLSTDCWERAQFVQAFWKFVAKQLSNIPAGKVTRLLQLFQALLKYVPWLKSRAGKEVRLVQLAQALGKVFPELTSRSGKEVKLEQPNQA